MNWGGGPRKRGTPTRSRCQRNATGWSSAFRRSQRDRQRDRVNAELQRAPAVSEMQQVGVSALAGLNANQEMAGNGGFNRRCPVSYVDSDETSSQGVVIDITAIFNNRFLLRSGSYGGQVARGGRRGRTLKLQPLFLENTSCSEKILPRRHGGTEDIPVEVLFHASLISLNLARLVSP